MCTVGTEWKGRGDAWMVVDRQWRQFRMVARPFRGGWSRLRIRNETGRIWQHMIRSVPGIPRPAHIAHISFQLWKYSLLFRIIYPKYNKHPPHPHLKSKRYRRIDNKGRAPHQKVRLWDSSLMISMAPSHSRLFHYYSVVNLVLFTIDDRVSTVIFFSTLHDVSRVVLKEMYPTVLGLNQSCMNLLGGVEKWRRSSP